MAWTFGDPTSGTFLNVVADNLGIFVGGGFFVLDQFSFSKKDDYSTVICRTKPTDF